MTEADEAPVSLILNVAGVILLLILLGGLIWLIMAPKVDVNKEAAKSYFTQFQKSVDDLKSTGSADFVIFKNKYVFLVYFGDNFVFTYTNPNKNTEKVDFSSLTEGKNKACICYKTSESRKEGETQIHKSLCVGCVNLDYPAVFSPLGEDKVNLAFGSEGFPSFAFGETNLRISKKTITDALDSKNKKEVYVFYGTQLL